MRKKVLNILAVLVTLALTVQMAAAAPRSAGKAGRAHASVNHQLRDAFDFEPKPVGSKSCDIFACYEN